METRIGTNGDINVSVDGGQNIGVHVGSGGLDSLGKRAFTVGIGEGSAITIDGDYRKMHHLPSINGVKIIGELSLEDLELKAVYYDTTEHFDSQPNLTSRKGALYIYSDYLDYADDDGAIIVMPGIRIGDGHTLLKDLPFIGGGASGSGTTNYNALRNKPSINGVTLAGDVSLEDLSLKAVYFFTREIFDEQYTIIPPEGDIFIISDYFCYTDEFGTVTSYAPAVIIGDGIRQLGSLHPMVGYDADRARGDIVSYLDSKNSLVTQEDREKWNKKRLRVMFDDDVEECLRFYYE